MSNGLDEVKRQVEQLEALRLTALDITAQFDRDSLLRVIVERAVKLLKAKSGGIYEYSASQGELVVIADYKRPHRIGKKLNVGEGLAGRLIQSNSPHIMIANYSKWEGRLSVDEEEHQYGSVLQVPLKLADQIIGVLYVEDDVGRSFTSQDARLLGLFADYAAIAYDRSRRKEALSHMRYAAEALAGAADSHAVLKQIVDHACIALRADSAAIWTYDASRNSFIPEGWFAINISLEMRNEFWKARPSAAGTASAIMARKWVGVDDISDAHAYPFIGASTRLLLNRIGVKSFIGMCLEVGTEPLGVLYVNYSRQRIFDEDEMYTARTFANHAALALKNARLMEQVKKAKEAAEAVARVTVLGNREDVLGSIVIETQRALDCDAVILYAYDTYSLQLTYPPTMVGVRDERKVATYGVIDTDSIVHRVLEKDEPYFAESIADDPLFGVRGFTHEERIKSCVGIPLKVMDEKVGVMFINYRTPHRFTTDEMSSMSLFANQAAIAIRNAQLFDSRNRQLRQQGTLLKFSQELLGIVGLQEILERAVVNAAGTLGADFCAIVLPDSDGELSIQAAYGWEESPAGKVKIKSGNGSQAGLTLMTHAPVIVDDYHLETRFEVPGFILEHGAVSGASILMSVDEEGARVPVGVMLVHSKVSRRFSDEDISLLQLIANGTAIAIQRTHQYDELKMARWRIGARTALAWMGMVSNYYQHSIVGHANTINANVELIKAIERKKNLGERLPSWVGEYLTRIRESATKIIERPITPPLSSEEGVADVEINQLVSERLEQLVRNGSLKTVKLVAKPDPTVNAIVRISPEWFRRVLDILIDNAVRELLHIPEERRLLEVNINSGERHVEIAIRDSGRGFSSDIEDKIFKGKIEKHQNVQGLGMGLLMAQAITETYGGRLKIKETSSSGTTMAILLPLVSSRDALPRK